MIDDENLSMIYNTIKQQDKMPHMVSINRYNHMEFVHEVVKYITKGSDVNISYHLNEPIKSMGYITITGANIEFTNAEWFLKMCEYIDSFEVTPKLDGTVEMNLVFQGITKAY